MDLGAVLAVIGSLAGVALGSLLVTRSQIVQQQRVRSQAIADAKQSAYVDFLATVRRLRRFILTEDVEVRLVEGSGRALGPIPVIERSTAYWDAVETALSRVWLLGDPEGLVMEAARKLLTAFTAVATARATHGPGAVPQDVIDGVRAAERNFVQVAREDLAQGSVVGR